MGTNRKNIFYGKQHITDADIQAVTAVLQSDFLTQGPAINQFEENFAHYVGARFAVAVANGTAALHLSALALQVRPGDRWITSPITFAASANCIRYCGGIVDFVDIDPHRYTIDLDKLEDKLKQKGAGFYKGVIPVDFAGYPVDMERLKNLATQFGLKIIEDACHAPGGYFKDTHNRKQACGNGQFADLSIFSFHPVKHIASGEGGMITTNNEQLFRKLLKLRTHGITKNPDEMLDEPHGPWYYEMQELGYNYRMPDILAALGNSQLSRAASGLARRIELAARYNSLLKNLPVKMPLVDEKSTHAWHLYIIQTKNRKELVAHLNQNHIFPQVHYIPVHLLPYYRQMGWKEGDFPEAENYYNHCLSLPLYPSLTNEEQDFVAQTITEFYK